MALNNQNINGDLSVQKDLNIGGSTTQQGDGLIKGNLEVKGWLIANKVRGDFVNKGLFQSEDELKAALPNPYNGWWALVCHTTNQNPMVYNAYSGQWKWTGQFYTGINFDSNYYNEKIAEIEENIDKIEDDIENILNDLQSPDEIIGYTYLGLATPDMMPETGVLAHNVFYIAIEDGEYLYFGIKEHITEVSIIYAYAGRWKIAGLGIPFGLKEHMTTVEGNIEELQREVFKVTVTLDSSQNTVVEWLGHSITNTLTWSVKYKGEPLIPSSVSLTKQKDGGNVETIVPEYTPNTSSESISAPITDLGVTSFTVNITANGINRKAQKAITTILPIYIGFGKHIADNGSINPDGTTQQGGLNLEELILQGLLERHLRTNLDNVKELTNNNDSYRLIIALPDGLTLVSIKSNGFDIDMADSVSDKRILSGNDYYYSLYRSSAPIIVGTIEELVIAIR